MMYNRTSCNSKEHPSNSVTGVDFRLTEVDDSGLPTMESSQELAEESREPAEKGKIGCTACRLIEGFLDRVTAVCDCTVCKRVNDCLKQQFAGESKQVQGSTDHKEALPAQDVAIDDSNDTPLPQDEIEYLLEIADDTPNKKAQERDDHIEGLKRQAEEAKDLDARLAVILERRKEEFKNLEAARRAQDGRQEFTIKVSKKTKSSKRNT